MMDDMTRARTHENTVITEDIVCELRCYGV